MGSDGTGGLAAAAANDSESWATSGAGRQAFGADRVQRPSYPPYGMSTPQLAASQYAFTAAARERIAGIGAEQYDDEDHQRFEDMSPARVLRELRDELLDAVNYLAFLDILVERWLKVIETE